MIILGKQYVKKEELDAVVNSIATRFQNMNEHCNNMMKFCDYEEILSFLRVYDGDLEDAYVAIFQYVQQEYSHVKKEAVYCKECYDWIDNQLPVLGYSAFSSNRSHRHVVEVTLDGIREKRDSILSILFQFMRGEYDDILYRK